MQRGAPKGNRNGAKGKQWESALRRALASFETGNVPKGEALQAIAKKVITLAVDGDKDAIREIGDRLDGKPTQYLDARIGPLDELSATDLSIVLEALDTIEGSEGPAAQGDSETTH